MCRKMVLTSSLEGDKQILGELVTYSLDGKILKKYKTLELPWLGNKRKVSCIPAGVYDLVKGVSKKNGIVYNVIRVVGRSGIQIHSGNFYYQIEGCILVGTGLKDINKDGLCDVINSRVAMQELFDGDFDELIVIRK